MKKLRKIIIIVVLALCLVLFFAPSQTRLSPDHSFAITAYHTDIQIDEDNTYHVTESITVNKTRSDGLYRMIPIIQKTDQTVDDQDQTISYSAKITSVDVQYGDFETYRDNGNFVIKIYYDGSVQRNWTYVITYDYTPVLYKTGSPNFIYFDLIADSLNSFKDNVTFSVTMPKDFDSGRIRFYSGKDGAAMDAQVAYTIEGNTISGHLKGYLSITDGLFLKIDLEDGYFSAPEFFPWHLVLAISAAALALLALMLYLLFCRNRKLEKPEAYYPPAGINSADAGYIIDTTADNKDVVSLLLYWATKGYLSIYQNTADDGSDDFMFVKQKELPPDVKKYEKQMFLYLFNEGDQINTAQIRLHFHATMASTKELIAAHYGKNENLLYTPASGKLRLSVQLLSFILVWGTLFFAFFTRYYSLVKTIAYATFGALVIVLPLLLIVGTIKRWQGLSSARRRVRLGAGIILSAAVLAAYVYFMSLQDLLVPGLAIAAATAFVYILSGIMRRRTELGSDLLGKLLGYKAFIEHAEKTRLERLVLANPDYFYSVLPYACVFSVVGKWASYFDNITLRAPEWYHVDDEQEAFSPARFAAAVLRAMVLTDNDMYARNVTKNMYDIGTRIDKPGENKWRYLNSRFINTYLGGFANYK